MKPFDVTDQVMKKIARYENGQIVAWYRKYVGILLVLSSGIGIVCYVVWKNLLEFGSLDMLTIFQEDREIIHAYWKEIVATMWEELPAGYIYLGLLLVIVVFCIIFATRSRRRIIRMKVTNLAKYIRKS